MSAKAYFMKTVNGCKDVSIMSSQDEQLRRTSLLQFKAAANTGCPNKHRNSVKNSISSLLCISMVIPDFKSYNINMSARVYFMKTVNGCKDVSILSLQDEL